MAFHNRCSAAANAGCCDGSSRSGNDTMLVEIGNVDDDDEESEVSGVVVVNDDEEDSSWRISGTMAFSLSLNDFTANISCSPASVPSGVFSIFTISSSWSG